MTTVTQRPALLRIAAAVASFLLVSLFVVQTSQAAFSATTTNTGNSFEVATVQLNDDATTPLFHHTLAAETDSSAMVPGTPVTACIVLDYTGTATTLNPVTLAASAPGTDLGAAGQYFTVAYEVDTADPTCGTTPAAFNDGSWTLDAAYPATGIAWTPTGAGDAASVWFAVTLSSTAPNGVQAAQVDDVDLTFSVSTP